MIPWVAHHRKHHVYADAEGDPHSPHAHGEGVRGALRGLAHAHLGWVLFGRRQQDRDRFIGDLREDRTLNRISDLFPVFAVLTFLIPAALGLVLTEFVDGRADRLRLGRPGARLLPAPRHLLHQLDLSLRRAAAIYDR